MQCQRNKKSVQIVTKKYVIAWQAGYTKWILIRRGSLIIYTKNSRYKKTIKLDDINKMLFFFRISFGDQEMFVGNFFLFILHIFFKTRKLPCHAVSRVTRKETKKE
jgi:hypothetical protein